MISPAAGAVAADIVIVLEGYKGSLKGLCVVLCVEVIVLTDEVKCVFGCWFGGDGWVLIVDMMIWILFYS